MIVVVVFVMLMILTLSLPVAFHGLIRIHLMFVETLASRGAEARKVDEGPEQRRHVASAGI